MPTLTVWDGVADCGDGRDRRVMVVYSDAQPTLVHRQVYNFRIFGARRDFDDGDTS